MAPVGEDEPSHDCPSCPTSPVSPSHTSANTSLKASLDEVSELHQRLSDLEDDNASLRANCVSLQLKLDQVKQATPSESQDSDSKQGNCGSTQTEATGACCQDQTSNCSECAQLREELKLSQSRCSELENLHQKLDDQIKLLEKQVEDFEKKENEYTSEISTLKLILNTTRSDEVDRAPANLSASETGDLSNDGVLKVNTEVQQSSNSQEEEADSVECYRKKFRILEKKCEDLQEQCRAAEKEKATLRTNIHKVSASWFQRKTRLSESETEGSSPSEESTPSDPLRIVGGKLPQGIEFSSEYRFWVKRIKDAPKLLAEMSFVNGKLDLAEKMCNELKKRVREYENVIDDQEIIIHGLKDQLDTYFTDNQKMSRQLSALTKLFEDLELTEKTRVNAVAPPEAANSANTNLPTTEDFKEMSNSLSKTYIKLKELILEKKALVTEIERLNVLNVELQRRVVTQENRLISVSDALHTTWMLVSDVKEQHEQLHTSESILRYELKEKRELLHHLREELECSREQWHKIRQMNSKSEEEWNSIREELDERRRVAEDANENGGNGQYEGAVALESNDDTSTNFEPPVDLLLDMAIEYGVVEADDETSTMLVAAMEGEDMHASRLQDLEDQCSHLYQKLMASTSRSLTLASRLTALHEHYGSSDEEDEDEYDDDYDEDEDDDDDDEDEPFGPYETEIMSPEPESYDTAYVSEADTGSASGVPGTLSEEEPSPSNLGGDEATATDDQAREQAAEVEDDLCRGLINFLPRKIEILRRDNQKLEERCQLLQEEKLHSEAHLTASVETEQLMRRQLEEKLEYLGKCVDELKLERNGQISEVEEKMKQKVASLNQFEKDYKALQEDLRIVNEKFEERGLLLHAANDRVNQLEKELHKSKTAAQENSNQLSLAKTQANEFHGLHEQLNCEYKELKDEVLGLQQQISDLRFQVSSHKMEREAAQKADLEKSQALEAASAQILEQKTSLLDLQKETASQRELLQNENDQLTVQVEKLNRILVDRDRECSGLNKHLQEAEVALKSAKDALSETKSKLGSNEEQTKQLNEDSEHLREKIIQLLREKDALWQANVRLEGAATGRSWMDNKSTQECLGCNAPFSLTRRRHHCRSCGRIFCTGCSDNWINTAASSRRVRVCDDCFSIHAELATIIASPAEQNKEETTYTQGAEGDDAPVSSLKGHPLPIGSKPPDDEEFSVISDDEVQNSRLSSSPSSGSPVSNEVVTETRATADILTTVSLSESPPTNAEVWVGAGTRVLVPADLPAGITLHWNFSSEPKSVSFAVLHQPPRSDTDEPESDKGASHSSQQRVLIPTTRVASAEGASVKGRLQTKQPGVYTLVFDNSCSRFTAKKVTYSLRLANVASSTNSTAGSTSSSPTSRTLLPLP